MCVFHSLISVALSESHKIVVADDFCTLLQISDWKRKIERLVGKSERASRKELKGSVLTKTQVP